jgi:hypothetical protein
LVCFSAGLYGYYEKKNFVYEIPEFKDLTISEGEIHFKPQWKSSGGELFLRSENFKTQVITTCNQPFAGLRDCGSHYYLDTNKTLRELTKNKHGKVWWYSDADIKNRDSFPFGRLYQLEVDGEIFYSYEERKAFYLHRFQNSEFNFGPTLVLMIFILPALFNLYKERSKSKNPTLPTSVLIPISLRNRVALWIFMMLLMLIFFA